MTRKIIDSLYDQFKNTEKKLKIICDWDEVIQACEPYALYLTFMKEKNAEKMSEKSWIMKPVSFSEFFIARFWNPDKDWECPIEYSPYGSKTSFKKLTIDQLKEQQAIKNSPNFYQEAPFLTIAEDLLRLIKEDKIEKIIFLTFYEYVEPIENTDKRLDLIFEQTFGKFPNCSLQKIKYIVEGGDNGGVELQMSKAEWIKQNASNFDIVIDDNPNICKSVVENYLPRRNCGKCNKVLTIDLAGGYEMADDGVNISYVVCRNKNCQKECDNFWKFEDVKETYNDEDKYWSSETDYTHYPTITRIVNKHPMTIIAPHYPATADQHHSEVLLIKNGVSELKKEDFENRNND